MKTHLRELSRLRKPWKIFRSVNTKWATETFGVYGNFDVIGMVLRENVEDPVAQNEHACDSDSKILKASTNRVIDMNGAGMLDITNPKNGDECSPALEIHADRLDKCLAHQRVGTLGVFDEAARHR